jgi:putative ABC transport system substrate-binding protein
VTAVPATPVPKNLGKIVVVRLGGAAAAEPLEKDLRDGLKAENLVDGTSYTIDTLDAGGDLARVATLLDDAAKKSAALLVTLHPEVARLAAERVKSIPLVSYTGVAPPAALGLVKSGDDQKPKATGAFAPLPRGMIVALACGCVPNDKRRLGVLFDAEDAASAAVKDGLVADGRAMAVPPQFETVGVHAASEIPAAVGDLVKRQAAAILLVPGQTLDNKAIIQEAVKAKLPVFGYSSDQAHAGALLVRVPVLRWGGFEAGRRAGKVLKGTEPQSLPFLESSVFHTIANEGVSKQIGTQIRGEFLRDAEVLH